MITEALRSGDLLLYAPKGWVGWIIATKTWSRVAHCEVYIGGGEAVASRDGTGVGRYPFRTGELPLVYRPIARFDLAAALRWFAVPFDRQTKTGTDGQPYDLLGLLRFVNVYWGSKTKQICSEFATRFYRAGGLEPFTREVDADGVAPRDFLLSPAFDHFAFVNGHLVPSGQAAAGV